MQNPKTAELFAEYADYHRHPTNVLTHVIGIPLIVYHIIAMLNWVTLFHVDAFGVAWPVTLAVPPYLATMWWYSTLDRELTPVMAVWFAACFPLGWIAPTWFVIATAVIGWATQLAGHVVWEKRSPAFLTNLKQALVGPLFFVDKVRSKLVD